VNAALKLWGWVGLAVVVIAGATGGALSWQRALRAQQLLREEDERFKAAVPDTLRERLDVTMLPLSTQGEPLTDGPDVLVNQDGISLGGRRASGPPPNEQLQRQDELFNDLKALSGLWRQLHPGEALHGRVRYWVDQNLSTLWFADALQTAGWAGFPDGCLVTRVRADPRQLQCLRLRAWSPDPSNGAPQLSPLAVRLTNDGQAELSWPTSADFNVKAVPVKDLAGAATEALRNRPMGAQEGAFLEALLFPRYEMHVQQLALVLEALLEPRVPRGAGASSALSVTLAKVMPEGAPASGGRLPPSEIDTRVRAAFPVFRRCYETGLARDRRLMGTVEVRFMIDVDGKVTRAEVSPDSTLLDPAVRQCVMRGFISLEFPRPVGGTVNVAYPIALTPGFGHGAKR
jgi:hypothetical protein